MSDLLPLVGNNAVLNMGLSVTVIGMHQLHAQYSLRLRLLVQS